MPVTSVEKDPDTFSFTLVADFTAPLARLWNAYLDPRQIERFWGPPTYPATFLRHDAVVGGRSVYKMTGPEGDEGYGCWEWTHIDALRSFDVDDWFADETGAPNTDMPLVRASFVFEETAGGSRLTAISTCESLEGLEQLMEMGVLEGTEEAMSQIDAVLADIATLENEGATGA
jgi:uncharacterized protein YndB with AHSA1/START domain